MKEKESANEECSEQERYIHALELQVETFALLASRLAQILRPEGIGSGNQMPAVRPKARNGSKAVAEMEVALGPSGSKAPTGSKRASSKAASDKVDRRKTPEYRKKQQAYQRTHYAKMKALREAAKAAKLIEGAA